MANGSDGSIVIDTELDNAGFEKGSDKLLSSVKSFGDQIAKAGEEIKGTLQAILPVLNSIASSTAQINSKIAGTATQATDANSRVADSEQRVAQAAQTAAQAVNQQGQNMGTLATGANAAQQGITALEKEVNSLSTGMAAISRSAETGFANGNAVLSFDAKLSDMEAKLTAAREKLEAFGQTKIPTEDYQWLTAAIQKAEAEYDKLIDRQAKMEATGVKQNSQAWENLQYDISLAQQKIAEYRADMAGLESSGGAFTTGADTAEYQRMSAIIGQTAESIERNRALIDSEALAQARLNVQAAQEQVVRATTASEREAAVARLRDAQQQLNDLASSMSNRTTDTAPEESSISGWQRFGSALKTAASSALKMAGSLAKIGFNAAKAGISSLIGKLKSFVSQGKKSRSMAESLAKSLTSLKRMLITCIKRMFISSIFNSAKESLQTLAQFSDAFNQSMSNIKNSAKGLSANLAVSLGGLISAIEPVLTKIIDMISTAISYLNAFFAMLGGKSTMTVAKKQTESYADSLDGAAGAAEELKNQVYGFDELNKRSDNSGGGGGASDGSDLFEEVPIDSILPDSLKAAFEELKQLWEDSEFFNFGKKLADIFNGGLKIVDDWINGTLRPKGTEWAANVAEILNGMVDGLDWNLLGKTLADGLNTAFDIMNTFLTTFDFENLGKGIGEAINGWFENVEWDLLATTVANKINAIVDTIHGAVTAVNWATMGDSIAEFVQTFFTAVDWDKAAETISTSVNGIVETFQHLIDGVDWQKIGTDLTTFVSDSITGIDWGAAFKSISDAFVSLEELILGAVQGLDWRGITAGIADGINNIDIATLLTNAAKIVSETIEGILNLAASYYETVDWGKMIDGLWNGLLGMLQNIDWGGIVSAAFEMFGAAIGGAVSMVATFALNVWDLLKEGWEIVKTYFSEYIEQFGGDVVAGLWAGIKNAFVNVGQWIWENIFEPFWDGLCSAFGIHSPSTKMMEIGDNIIKGLLQGIKDAWSGITSFFSTALSTIKSTLSDAWSNIKSTATTAWNGIKSGVTTAFTATKNAVTNTADALKTGLSNTWDKVKSTASTAWTNLKTTVTNLFTNTKNTVQNTGTQIKTTLSTAWDNVKTTASSAWNNVKSTVTNAFTATKNTLQTTANNIKSNLSSAWDSVKSTASTKWENVKSTVTTKWNALKATLNNTDWKSVGSNICTGIKNGIDAGWTWLKNTVSNLASNLLSAAKRVLGIASPSKVFRDEVGQFIGLGLAEGIEETTSTVVKTVKNLADATVDGFDSSGLSLDMAASDTVSGLDIVASKLSGIAETFRTITSQLTGIGSMSFPAIVTGQVIPMKTKIDTSTLPSDALTNDKFGAFASGMDEQMADLIYRLQQFMDLFDRRSRQTLNMDDLTAAITAKQNATVRSFGL